MGNHLTVRPIGNVEILYTHINLWLHITQCLSYLPLSIVCDLLPQNIQ